MTFMTTWPLWLSAIPLVGVTTVLAMLGAVLVRRRVGLEMLARNNEVAGFKFATVAVIYAVLLAFAVIVVWEKFSDAEDTVAREAGATATLYRLADGMSPQPRIAVREGVNAYLKAAIAEDWPAMERGRGSPAGTRALDMVYAATLAFQPADRHDEVVMTGLLGQLNDVTQARRARLVLATGIVPGVVWLVLFTGAVLTLSFTFFFGTDSLAAQVMMTGILAVMIFAGLLVIVAIDHPFAGSVHVKPEPLEAVLRDFGGEASPR